MTGVTKRFRAGAASVTALDAVTITLTPGSLSVVMGVSGSGKSTLLSVIAGLIVPDSGSVRINGQEIAAADLATRAEARLNIISLVFQEYNLLPMLSALDNVALVPILRGVSRRESQKLARRSLSLVHLDSAAVDRLPGELSGGQRQRVAIARALVHGDPAKAPSPVLLADEPTGALDSRTSKDIVAVMQSVAQEGGAVLIATHDIRIAEQGDYAYEMTDGHIERSGVASAPLAQ